MGLQMTEAEIVRKFKNWPDKPKYAVQGIADLNGVDKYVIVEILYRNGALNKASVSAYVRNGNCPASLRALFNEQKTEAVPDTKEVKKEETAADKVKHRDSSVIDAGVNHENRPKIDRAELSDAVQYLISQRLDELENAYKSARQIVTEYEELAAYLKYGVPVTVGNSEGRAD